MEGQRTANEKTPFLSALAYFLLFCSDSWPVVLCHLVNRSVSQLLKPPRTSFWERPPPDIHFAFCKKKGMKQNIKKKLCVILFDNNDDVGRRTMMMIMPCLRLIKSRQQCPHKREKSRKKAIKSSRGTPDRG